MSSHTSPTRTSGFAHTISNGRQRRHLPINTFWRDTMSEIGDRTLARIEARMMRDFEGMLSSQGREMCGDPEERDLLQEMAMVQTQDQQIMTSRESASPHLPPPPPPPPPALAAAPTPPPNNRRWMIPLAVAGVSAIAFPPLTVWAITQAGFTSGGIAAGSLAASFMSSYGGTVAAGSACATMQSIGATGVLSAAGSLFAGGVGGIFGGATAAAFTGNDEARRQIEIFLQLVLLMIIRRIRGL